MIKNFVDQIKKDLKIAIYGAGYAGIGLKKYIEKNRKDLKISFFIDAYKKGDVDNIPIIDFNNIESVKNSIDLIVCATRRSLHELVALFNYLNIPNIYISHDIQQYYRNEEITLRQKETLEIFKYNEDRELYDLIWKARISKTYKELAQYVEKKHNIGNCGLSRNYEAHYMEFINKDAIKTVIDGGFCNGIHALTFKKNFKNLKKTYAFEPMYEKFKNKLYDEFIRKGNFCEIINKGLWKFDKQFNFALNTKAHAASRIIKDASELKQDEIQEIINTTSIDNFRVEKNIEKIDLIKMDIEGSEIPALEGAIKTITNDRPQLAISIYHSSEDFITIPKYLHDNLENYEFRLGHYSADCCETVLYGIPKELVNT